MIGYVILHMAILVHAAQSWPSWEDGPTLMKPSLLPPSSRIFVSPLACLITDFQLFPAGMPIRQHFRYHSVELISPGSFFGASAGTPLYIISGKAWHL